MVLDVLAHCSLSVNRDIVFGQPESVDASRRHLKSHFHSVFFLFHNVVNMKK